MASRHTLYVKPPIVGLCELEAERIIVAVALSREHPQAAGKLIGVQLRLISVVIFFHCSRLQNAEQTAYNTWRQQGELLKSPRAFAYNYFALFTILGIILPYYQKLLHLQEFNERSIGYILAAFNLAGIFASPFMGWMSDRSRFNRLIITALTAGTALCLIIFGMIESFWPALGLAVVFGTFFWPLPPLNDGLVLKQMSKYGGDYGKVRSLGSVAFICSVVVIELLGVSTGGSYGVWLIVVVGGGACLFYAFVFNLFPLESKKKPADIVPADGTRLKWSVLHTRPFLTFLVVVFLARFSMTAYYSFFTLFLSEELDFQQAGYLWTIATIAEIPIIFFSSAIIKRIGVRNMFALGIGATAVRLMGLSLVTNIFWVFPLQLLHAFTFGSFFTASIHYLDRTVPHHMKQSATALLSSVAFGLPAITGSALGGELIHEVGFRYMYGWYSITALAALAALFMFVKEPEDKSVTERVKGESR